MGAAEVEGEFDAVFLVVPVEGVFHFVAVVIILAVSDGGF